MLIQPFVLGDEDSRYMKYEPDCALAGPVPYEGVLLPRTHRFLPFTSSLTLYASQLHMPCSNVQLPDGAADGAAVGAVVGLELGPAVGLELGPAVGLCVFSHLCPLCASLHPDVHM